MSHCSKCGTLTQDGAAFCPNCGAPQASGAPIPAGSAVPPPGASYVPSAQSVDTGLEENVAGLLSYSVGWVTGLVFFLIDKRPFVRFHAAQSMVIFGGLTVLRVALILFLAASHGAGLIFFPLFGLLQMLLLLIGVILWVLCMVKAYQHELYRLPIAADIADNLCKR
jgi:uncharacterized membrane protein